MKQYILLLFISAGFAACSNYGKKVSGDYLTVYYKEGINKEQAQKALDYFLPLWKDSSDKTKDKSIQLTKNGDTINFRMVSIMEVIDKMDENIFYTTGNEISKDLFSGAPVNVVLTDERFKTVRTFTFKKIATSDYGQKIIAGNIEVYYKEGPTAEEARRLADYLNTSMNPESKISFQISKDEHGFLLRMVSDIEKAKELPYSTFYDLAEEVSKNVFSGSHLTFQLTDEMFKSYKTFEYGTDLPATENTTNQ